MLPLPLRLDQYHLEKYLWQHNLSFVYLARDMGLERKVSLKVLSDEGRNDPEEKARFLQEARLLSGLMHENILNVYDFGEYNGAPYLVTEVLVGKTLEEFIRSDSYSRSTSLKIMLQVARALEFVHSKSIIHRDIKPQNFFVSEGGGVKLIDFAAAKVEGGMEVTRAGFTVGTPYYMAPEQVLGQVATSKADIYAFGLLLIEILVRHKPILGESIERIFDQILYNPIDLAPLINAGTPEAIVALAERCTAKQPLDRPASMTEVIAKLRECDAAIVNKDVGPLRSLTEQRTNGDAFHKDFLKAISANSSLVNMVAKGRRWLIKFGTWRTDLKVPRPLNVEVSEDEYCIPLRSGFRFVHEPASGVEANRLLARDGDICELVHRLHHSTGGAHLVTGYRGVGKTSYINHVIESLRAELEPANSRERLVLADVHLSLAKSISAAELMHTIVRRLVERIKELGLFADLPSELCIRLTVAYDRTCFNMTRKLGAVSEFSLGKAAGLEASAGTSHVGKIFFTVPFEHKSTRSMVNESTYLGYTDRAAEQDIIEISRLLAGGVEKPRSLRRRITDSVSKRAIHSTKFKIVFVFDELDKMTDVELGDNNQTFDEILRNLKTLFTTSGISFIFVAGRDLYDQWIQDVRQGDSVYESIFAFNKYLPCLWADAGSICDAMIDVQSPAEPPCGACAEAEATGRWFCGRCARYVGDVNRARKLYVDFLKYLSYRGRGIPRRILRNFNQSVRWFGAKPVVVCSREEVRRHRLYGELWDLLQKGDSELQHVRFGDGAATDLDRTRLAICYLLDRILEQGRDEFTIADVRKWSQQLSRKVRPLEGNADSMSRSLIRVLLQGDFLVEVKDEMQFVQVDRWQAHHSRYRLAPRRIVELGGEEDTRPGEIISLQGGRRCGNYQLSKQIGVGGTAKVFLASDSSGRQSALKMIERLEVDSVLVEQFRREALLMAALRHRNIVRFHEAGEDGGAMFLSMEYVDGIDLKQLIQGGLVDSGAATYVAREVATAVAYLHDKGLIRNDVKPGNVLIDRSGRVVLIDFGITDCPDGVLIERSTLPLTAGTPLYMAPEQFAGQNVGPECDIYAIGLILYELLVGRRPFDYPTYEELVNAHTKLPPPSLAELIDVESELEAVVGKCLAKKPEERFPSGAALLNALNALPVMERGAVAELVKKTAEKVESKEARMREETGKGLPGEFTRMFDAGLFGGPPPTPPPRRLFETALSFTRRFQKVSEGEADPGSSMFGASHSLLAPTDFKAENGSLKIVPGRRVPNIDAPCISLSGEIALKKPRTTIGRDAENDVVSLHSNLSRFHAEIVFDPLTGFWIVDLASENGTKVDGRRVEGKAPLRNNSSILCGDLELLCQFSTT